MNRPTHRLLIIPAVGLITALLFGFSSVARADSTKTYPTCTTIPEKCTGTGGQDYVENYTPIHECAWSGLTLHCTDTPRTLCKADSDACVYVTPGTAPIAGIFQVEDAVTQFVRLAQWGLGIVAILAVLMFVWAGWKFITAGGRGEMIEEGKRIIGGTITGILISFSAYVIINFAVFALTGASINSLNGKWSGPLSVVFPGTELQQPFAGNSGTVENRTNCRSANNDDWNKGCSDHIYCADPDVGTSGEIATIQKKLNTLGCNCGKTVDGCYGKLTLDCVRRFQAANLLPLSGEIDSATAGALNAASPVGCSNPLAGVDPTEALSRVPAADYPSASANDKNIGACVVTEGGVATGNPMYCLDHVRETTCKAIGAGNLFYEGQSVNSSILSNLCGYCQTRKFAVLSPNTFNCFEYATKYWCENVATDSGAPTDPLVFHGGSCQNNACNRGTCRTTTLVHPR